MPEPRILNRKGRLPLPDAIYVGRPSKWGNPYTIGKHGTRDAVITLYETHLLSSPHLIGALHELRGRDLECWCAPKRCHGEVLRTYANLPQAEFDALTRLLGMPNPSYPSYPVVLPFAG